jgi:hypothetical protein
MDTEKKNIFDEFVLTTIGAFNMKHGLFGNIFYFPEINSLDLATWADDKERGKVMQVVADMCLKNCLSYFIFASEAWISTYTEEEVELAKKLTGHTPRPSQDPKKKEVVICTFVSKKEAFASCAPIIDVMGKRLLGEWADLPSENMTSAWQECFV